MSARDPAAPDSCSFRATTAGLYARCPTCSVARTWTPGPRSSASSAVLAGLLDEHATPARGAGSPPRGAVVGTAMLTASTPASRSWPTESNALPPCLRRSRRWLVAADDAHEGGGEFRVGVVAPHSADADDAAMG